MPENTKHQKTAPAALTVTPRTEAQKEASRINGSNSSGPTTLNGKDKSSRNALRHGLTAFELALSNEDAEAFNNVLADYTAEYLPVTYRNQSRRTNRFRPVASLPLLDRRNRHLQHRDGPQPDAALRRVGKSN